jgi:quercetin dioxygenase-like cupin family protein
MEEIKHSNPYILKNMIQYSPGSTVSKVLTKSKSGNTTLFAFDQGQELSEHTAPFDAIAQIIEGKCRIRIDGIDYHLQEGRMIIMPAGIPHALEATEAFKMLLIMVRS